MKFKKSVIIILAAIVIAVIAGLLHMVAKQPSFSVKSLTEERQEEMLNYIKYKNPEKSLEEEREEIRKENKGFLAVKDNISKIIKGRTTEKEILELFGRYLCSVDINDVFPTEVQTEKISQPCDVIYDTIASRKYLKPRSNQKILGYSFNHTDYYGGMRSASGTELGLLVTINIETGLVDDFYYFESPWIS